MPQNLVGAPATFSRLVETVFRGLNWKICLAYLDDVIVFSHTFQDHLLHLRQVFERLAESNLWLKVNKCHFAKKEVEYLGHRLSSKGISPDTSKIETIASYPTPKNPKALRSFLGLTGFYRRFIAGYAVKSSPLRKLLKKNVAFVWIQECEKAFRGLKDSLMRYPVLSFPDFNKPFKLYTDGSYLGIGALLIQDQDDMERVIAYTGRSLNCYESKYPITELEALAMIHAITKFDVYLRHNSFIVYFYFFFIQHK